MSLNQDELSTAYQYCMSTFFNAANLHAKLLNEKDNSSGWPNYHEYIFTLKNLSMILVALNYQIEVLVREFEDGL